MRSILLLCFATLTLGFLAGCRSHSPTIQQDKANASLWHLSNDQVELTVDLAKRRISSYGFRGGRNVLWVNPKVATEPVDANNEPNWGGDRVWIWPQRYWNWPPPMVVGDSRATVAAGGRLVVTSGIFSGYGVRAVREIQLAPHGTQVTITTRLEAVPGAAVTSTKPIAPWTVSQVPAPRRILAHVPSGKDRETYLRRAPDGFVATKRPDSFIELARQRPVKPDAFLKTFLDADTLIAIYDDVTFTQHQLPAHTQGTWTPTERCQVFHTTDDSFVELEWTSPMLPPAQLSQTPLCVTWTLSRQIE